MYHIHLSKCLFHEHGEWWLVIDLPARFSQIIIKLTNLNFDYNFTHSAKKLGQGARINFKAESHLIPPNQEKLSTGKRIKKVTFDRNCTFYVQMNGVCVSHFTHHINSHPQSPAKYSWSWKVEMCWMEGIEMNEWTKRRRRKRTKQLSAYW